MTRPEPDQPINDPVLKRFRSAVGDLYGDGVERVMLFGSRARAMRGRILTMIRPSS